MRFSSLGGSLRPRTAKAFAVSSEIKASLTSIFSGGGIVREEK
jgi:hypothetical protein